MSGSNNSVNGKEVVLASSQDDKCLSETGKEEKNLIEPEKTEDQKESTDKLVTVNGESDAASQTVSSDQNVPDNSDNSVQKSQKPEVTCPEVENGHLNCQVLREENEVKESVAKPSAMSKVDLCRAIDVLIDNSDNRSRSATVPQKQRRRKPPVSSKDSPKQVKTKKTKKPIAEVNHLVTDYFPIRRSSRVPRSELKKREQIKVEEAILSNQTDGLLVKMFPGKGRGVVAEKTFKKGEFVVEYSGDLIDLDTAKQRDKDYKENKDVGCYMYYFSFMGKNYCVDATEETGKLGRLLNHSKTSPNCCTRIVAINKQPYLIIVAARDISVGEELVYDYGDRNKETLAHNPWLAF